MEEGEDVFEARLQKALTFLAKRRFGRELRQEHSSSQEDVLAVLPTVLRDLRVLHRCGTVR